jgi:Chromate resistance exported protein
LPTPKLIESFNKAREKEYSVLTKTLRGLIGRNKKATEQRFVDEVDRIKRHFRDIREIDFFNSPRAQEVEMLLQKIEKGRGARKALPKIDPKNYCGETWLTRPRPEIDRVGSAWLIRKIIDPEAKFIFASTASEKPDAISFDMLDAEFSHHDGNHGCCEPDIRPGCRLCASTPSSQG